MLGTKLKRLRYQCGFTQKQIADLLNVDRSTYTYYETGRTRPDVDMIVKIANVYKVSCDDLLGHFVTDETGSALMHGEESEYSILRRALSICDLDREEQNLILVFRQLSAMDKQAVSDFTKEKMLAAEAED